ncbi:ribonuclease HII [Candidatus Bathyarchaeota archaeon]|jgi:ribonuclease HII|nr:ribonuclease HII [Candidatus Bathyarchaeota archaeon]
MGCVIGPLVIAGVSIKKEATRELSSIGVRDSKVLSPTQRTNLAIAIRNIAHDISIVELPPEEIDEYVLKGRKLRKLNYLEATAMAKVIRKLNPAIAYVDSSDVRPERFADDIQEHLVKRIRIISEHHADQKYPVVSAASIIAKVTRDQRIAEIEDQYGDFGSGYPSDERTIRFLEDWVRKHGSFPGFVRKSWKTISRIEQGIRQTKL